MSNNITDTNESVINSDSAATPPQLSTLGLHRTSKMPKTNESQRLLRSQTADKEDEELFVKLPKFTKRPRSKNILENQEEYCDPKDAKELVSAYQRLYKFLKQPNSQRWIWCEFVESFIDKAILSSGYNIKWFLRSIYPQLQHVEHQLPLRCWQIVRREMGKSRRFSPAFIESEKRELNRNRNVVRLLQQRKMDVDHFGLSIDVMPKVIPMPLTVDTKVISLLRAPHEMLYKGCVLGYEPKNSSYLIKFDTAGKHIVLSMSDSLLHVVNDCKGVPLATVIREAKDKQQEAAKDSLTDVDDDNKVRKPHPVLDAFLQLHKLLGIKRKTVQDMAGMNEELEAIGTQASARREIKVTPQREKLQRRYAANMITLHRVNANILDSLREAHNQLTEYEKTSVQFMSEPRKKLYMKCRLLAEMDLKSSPALPNLKLLATRDLVLQLQTLLYIYSELGQGNDQEVDAVLDDFLADMLSDLPSQLRNDFQHIVQLLQPLRKHILTMRKMESERCQQQQQLELPSETPNTNTVTNDDSDVDMSI